MTDKELTTKLNEELGCKDMDLRFLLEYLYIGECAYHDIGFISHLDSYDLDSYISMDNTLAIYKFSDFNMILTSYDGLSFQHFK